MLNADCEEIAENATLIKCKSSVSIIYDDTNRPPLVTKSKLRFLSVRIIIIKSIIIRLIESNWPFLFCFCSF